MWPALGWAVLYIFPCPLQCLQTGVDDLDSGWTQKLMSGDSLASSKDALFFFPCPLYSRMMDMVTWYEHSRKQEKNLQGLLRNRLRIWTLCHILY